MSKVRGSWVLTAGASTFAAYVLVHPRGEVEDAVDVKQAVHSMADESAWVASHVVGLVALLLIGLGLRRLLRAGWLAESPRTRRSAWLLLAGTAGASIELVPHVLVATETRELAAGGSTPLTNLHLLFQAALLPVYGLGVAALALTGFGIIAHRAACVLGIVGGAALTVVGPLLLLTDDPALGKLFMAGAGTFLFLLAAGIHLVRAGGTPRDARRSRRPTPVATG